MWTVDKVKSWGVEEWTGNGAVTFQSAHSFLQNEYKKGDSMNNGLFSVDATSGEVSFHFPKALVSLQTAFELMNTYAPMEAKVAIFNLKEFKFPAAICSFSWDAARERDKFVFAVGTTIKNPHIDAWGLECSWLYGMPFGKNNAQLNPPVLSFKNYKNKVGSYRQFEQFINAEIKAGRI